MFEKMLKRLSESDVKALKEFLIQQHHSFGDEDEEIAQNYTDKTRAPSGKKTYCNSLCVSCAKRNLKKSVFKPCDIFIQILEISTGIFKCCYQIVWTVMTFV